MDPELAKIMAAWPTLPESIRMAILCLVGETSMAANRDRNYR
jgi:hypothetical protein